MPKISERVRLSKRIIDASKAKTSDYVLWDNEVPGFGIRVASTGRKTFVFQYFTGTRSRRITLGTFGALTADQARQKARSLKQQVKDGHDPLADKQAERAAETVSDFCDRFLEEHVGKKKYRTQVEYKRMIKDFIRPELGKMRVKDVDTRAISRLHRKLGKTPYQANRVLAVLSKMFTLSEKWGVRAIGTNPCLDVERFTEKPRERYLTSDESQRLARALNRFENEEDTLPSITAAIRLLLLTGARLQEILELKWEYVDFENQCLHLPDSKTGQKTLQLNAPATKILSKIERSDKSPWVIAGRKKGGHLVNLMKPWRKIRSEAGIPDVRLHDLRHSFAATAAGMGHSLPMIGALLGHSQAQTTARYAHLANAPVKQANETIGQRIESLMDC